MITLTPAELAALVETFGDSVPNDPRDVVAGIIASQEGGDCYGPGSCDYDVADELLRCGLLRGTAVDPMPRSDGELREIPDEVTVTITVRGGDLDDMKPIPA